MAFRQHGRTGPRVIAVVMIVTVAIGFRFADGVCVAEATVGLGVASELAPTEGSIESRFGSSVSISSDGDTALVGAPGDSSGRGACWVFVKVDGTWEQRGTLLLPSDSSGSAEAGYAVALSANGEVALVGGIGDDGDRGAAWIYTRSGETWTQRGSKLLPSDASPEPHNVLFGASVALSEDGSTAVIGGYGDEFGGYGGAWVFVRSGNSWIQQGPRFAPASERLGTDGYYSWFGSSVAVSADGNTALVGGEHDEEGVGAAWVYTRSGEQWAQQGAKLTSGGAGQQTFGDSVSLSADGDTALVGAERGAGGSGAAWTFTWEGASWARSAPALTPPDLEIGDGFGHSVALDPSGADALLGAPGSEFGQGAAWATSMSGGAWGAEGSVSLPSPEEEGSYGYSLASSLHAGTVVVGGPNGPAASGKVWVFEHEPLGRRFLPMSVFGAAAEPPGTGIEAHAFFEGEASGTVTWRWYPPNATSCAGQPLGTISSPVRSEDGFSTTDAVIPVTALGDYLLVASYSGESETAPVSTGCGAASVVLKAWPALTVTAPPSVQVGQGLNIVPELRGGVEPAGTLELLIFEATGCAGTPVAEETVPIGSAQAARPLEYVPVRPGRLFVFARFGGDANNFGVDASACDATHAIIVEQAKTSVGVVGTAVRVGEAIAANAHVAGYAPSGTVDFDVYSPDDPACAASPTATVSAPLAADGDAVSGPFAAPVAGIYHFIARYSGDTNNRGGTSACSAVVVERRPTGVKLHGAVDVAGYGSVEGVASVAGGYAPRGTVTFSLFRSAQRCHGRPLIAVLTSVVGGIAKTEPLGPLAPGHYSLAATYVGDENNEPGRAPCAATASVPAILRHVAVVGNGVRVELRCQGVTTASCRGTLTLSVPKQVLRTTRFRVRRGTTDSRLIELSARALRSVRSGGTSYLTVAAQLDEEGRRLGAGRVRLRVRGL